MIRIALLVLSLACAQATAFTLDETGARQLLVVVTDDWGARHGRLHVFGRSTERWQRTRAPTDVVVGAKGLAWGIGLHAMSDHMSPQKQEGDRKAPAGVFALGPAFGYAPAALRGSRVPYTPADGYRCVDDAASRHYNRVLDPHTVVGGETWRSSEQMRRTDELYRWVVVVDHNGGVSSDSRTPISGRGSCIFLHVWRDSEHGTAGCTAMPRLRLEALLKWLDPAKKPVLVQLPLATYDSLREQWALPALNDVER